MDEDQKHTEEYEKSIAEEIKNYLHNNPNIPQGTILVSERAFNLNANLQKEVDGLNKHIKQNQDWQKKHEAICEDLALAETTIEELKVSLKAEEEDSKECSDELHRLAKQFDLPDDGPMENVFGAYKKYTFALKTMDIYKKTAADFKEKLDFTVPLLRKQLIKKGLIIEKGDQIAFEIIEEWCRELGLNFDGVDFLMELLKTSYTVEEKTENGVKVTQPKRFVEKV